MHLRDRSPTDVVCTPVRLQGSGTQVASSASEYSSFWSSATLGGYGRGSVMGAASGVCTGADLLRLGGPPRGWYPRQRHRPASTEHLDRLTTSSKIGVDHPVAWEGSGARKPLTLPPNLTPKFFQKSPREALRRVTSLLIRKAELTDDLFILLTPFNYDEPPSIMSIIIIIASHRTRGKTTSCGEHADALI
ncbi:hypothetical protein RR48_14208 [Papilio machaon]|uniref:Uncharacterized protein n=1 Tax=Papilio machaon TaxID=76193 RepID=A0A194QM81_PAPMA|nr:hypothetical protein RR48_14208 [Papilio machaon]